jgi:hypothetical protein
MYEEVIEAIELLKEMWQLDEKITRYKFIDCEELEINYSHSEIEEMCRQFCKQANRYLRDNDFSKLHYASHDGEDTYIIKSNEEVDYDWFE